MKKQFLSLCLLAAALAACNGEQQTSQEETAADTATENSQRSELRLEEIWATGQVLETPESVFYNADEDILYVSNIAGGGSDKNGQGYISRLSLLGEIVEQQWVTGLHAPKGMGMMNGKLYVADVDQLVEIDVQRGEISNRYPVEGASFLNDVTVTADNKVLFSDSDQGKIHVFDGEKVSLWNEENLSRPNGLLAHGGRILLASSGSNDVKEVSEGAVGDLLAQDIGAGDGLVAVNENTYLVSNWQGEVYFIGPDGQKEKLLDTKEQGINSADIEYIQERNLLLVPTFNDNRVVAYRLHITP